MTGRDLPTNVHGWSVNGKPVRCWSVNGKGVHGGSTSGKDTGRNRMLRHPTLPAGGGSQLVSGCTGKWTALHSNQ
jgi:hypothetical protein